MDEEAGQEGKPARTAKRRATQGRQQREPGGRNNIVKVKLTDEEQLKVSARAISLGISEPRLMVETVLYGSVATVAERHALYRELMGVRRLVAALGNNVNQLARHANSTGELQPETGAALDAVTRVLPRLDVLLSSMAAPPDRSTADEDFGKAKVTEG